MRENSWVVRFGKDCQSLFELFRRVAVVYRSLRSLRFVQLSEGRIPERMRCGVGRLLRLPVRVDATNG